MFKKQREGYHTRNSKALVQHKCVLQRMGYIVLCMKERECGISWICLLEVRIVLSKVYINCMEDEVWRM